MIKKTNYDYKRWYAVRYRTGGISVHPFVSDFALEFALKNKLIDKVLLPFYAQNKDSATLIAERKLRK